MSESEAPTPGESPRAQRSPARLAALIALAVLAVGVTFLFPVLQQLLHPNPNQESLMQARRIYNACQAYSSVRGHLPGSLEDLVPDFLNDRRALADPSHPEEGDIGYYYYGSGSRGTEPPETVFLAGKHDTADQRVVVRFDGVTRMQDLPEKALPGGGMK
jgi:type II secretory pathway pseudopilin PulG